MLPQIKTILYATDLGQYAVQVLRYAAALARVEGAKIHLLYVVEPLGPTGKALVRNVLPEAEVARLETEANQHLRELLHQQLKNLAAELGSEDESVTGVSEILIREGRPNHVILDEARTLGADLIVMGSHTHSGLEHFLLGSVARRVTNLSTIPVLLVPIPAGD